MTKTKNRFPFPILSLVLLLASALGASDASALTALRQVQVSNGTRVDLLFDGKVSRGQIKTEFFRDIIQISLMDVSVYPAKISSVSGGDITKIFAYQYAPKLVRCRLTVKGKAESYKNRFFLSSAGPGGKMLTVRLEDRSSVQLAAAPALRDADERALLERVMKSGAPAPSAAAGKAKAPDTPDTSDTIVEKSAAPASTAGTQTLPNTENRPLNLNAGDSARENRIGGASELPSPLSALAKLALVIGLFSLVALGFKKLWKPGETGSRSVQDGRLMGALGRFARKNLGVGSGKSSAIEVLSNHHLGPKKSIAVIKVGGRTMVVGITEQSINLISQLSPHPFGDDDTLNALAELDSPPLEEAAKPNGPAVFSKLLQSETAKPAVDSPTTRRDVRVTSYGNSSGGSSSAGNNPATAIPAQASPITAPGASNVSPQAALGLSGVRAQIRSKLEGLKQI